MSGSSPPLSYSLARGQVVFSDISAQLIDRCRGAFSEASRVLRPGGRLSIFEPINRFSFPEPPGRLLGYDVSPIDELAAKVKAEMEASPDEAALLDFDERDLFRWAEGSGCSTVRLTLEAEQTPKPPSITND